MNHFALSLGLFAGANPAGILNEFQELQALIAILETILDIINKLKLFMTDIDFDMDFIGKKHALKKYDHFALNTS